MNATGEKTTFMAVWVESIQSAEQPCLYDSYFCTKAADVRGASTDSQITFELLTNALSRSLLDGFERLFSHGFTVVEVPDGWQNEYRRPNDWREHFIYEALKQAADVPQRDTDKAPTSGYDVELASLVLKVLNNVYPQSVQLTLIKHELDNQPSDIKLLNVLDALAGDGYIEGQYHRGVGKLQAMASIKINGEGRRHLQDEMKRKSATQSTQAFHVNDASIFILTQLLSEFRERKLTSDDLQNTYQGLPPAQLKQGCVVEGIDEVDFDLAKADLEKHNLVKTGPMDLVDSPQGMLIIGFRSKNEYSFLTVDGYKEAVKVASSKPPMQRASAPHIHISGSTFHNSPIGVGNEIEQSVKVTNVSLDQTLETFRQAVDDLGESVAKRDEILSNLDELVAASGTPTMMDRYTRLVGVVSDHMTVFGPLLPLLWEKLTH